MMLRLTFIALLLLMLMQNLAAAATLSTCAVCSPGGRWVAAYTFEGKIVVYDLRDKDHAPRIFDLSHSIINNVDVRNDISFSADDPEIIVSGPSGGLEARNIQAQDITISPPISIGSIFSGKREALLEI